MDKSEDCQLVVARRYTRRKERLKIVTKWRESGLSLAEYAEKTGIAARSLYRWSNDAVPMQEAGTFIELTAMGSGAWAAEVMSKAGLVRLSGSASPAWAASLIRELNRC